MNLKQTNDVVDVARLEEFKKKHEEWRWHLNGDDLHSIWKQQSSLLWDYALSRTINELRIRPGFSRVSGGERKSRPLPPSLRYGATSQWFPAPQSGAKATALQTLARLPSVSPFRGASGLRRVYRRYSARFQTCDEPKFEGNMATWNMKIMRCGCGNLFDVVRLHRFLAMVVWLCVIFVGVSLPTTALAAAEDTRLYEPAQLREDFTVLRNALEEAHIGLYRYTDKPAMDAAFDEVLKSLESPLSEQEFLKRLSPLLALIRDDHTFALPSDAYWRRLVGNRSSEVESIGVFPFYVKTLGDRIFISHNNSSDTSIPPGSEILSINHLQAKDVINALEKYVHTSGFVTSFKPRHLEQYNINQEFNIFCIYYAIYVATPRSFELQIRRPGAAMVETVTVPALPQSQLLANFRARYNGTNDWLASRYRAMDFTMPRADTAILRLGSFHEWQWNRDKVKPDVEIARVFQTLRDKRVSNLIVDLRGNEGGVAAITVEVLSRLAAAPFQLYRYKELKAYEFPKFAPYLRESAPKFAESLFEITPQHTYRIKTSLPDETWSRPLPPAGTNFTGKLYVLIDGATGSAAAQLATALRINRRDAIFVGEESGGDMEGPVSGSYLALKLPHTGVRVDVPLLKKVLNLDDYPYQRGRGVRPDHEVEWTERDLIERRDPVLSKALNLMEPIKK